MGLVNYQFSSMDEITDVEAKGYYKELVAKMSKEEAFHQIVSGTREHTRIPLPWNELPQVYKNLEQQTPDEEVTEFYKTMIALRKEDETLIYGDFKVLFRKKDRFVYARTLGDREYIIDCNLGSNEKNAYSVSDDYRCIISSGKCDKKLGAYGVLVWKK